MFKTTITLITATVLTVSAFGGGVKETARDQLKQAVLAHNADRAQKWASVLMSIEQAELAAESKKLVERRNEVATVGSNLIKSLPAIINALEYYNSLQKYPDHELSEMLKMCRLFIKLNVQPIRDTDLKPLVKSIRDRESNETKNN